MKGTHALISIGLVLVIGAAALAGEEQGAQPMAEKLRRSYDAPLEDPGAGRLYDEAGKLLEQARAMPQAVDLGELPPSVPPQEEAEAEAEGAVKPEPPAEEEWVAVSEAPVVEPEELARVHFRAGNYQEAAAIYRSLWEDSPGDVHLLQMLALSERNAGRADEALALMQEAPADSDAREWLDWMFRMMAMAERQAEEETE
ncbi:MAG: tetratricopeptide repeat protein [Candidatus Brocadiia bacterium]